MSKSDMDSSSSIERREKSERRMLSVNFNLSSQIDFFRYKYTKILTPEGYRIKYISQKPYFIILDVFRKLKFDKLKSN